MITVIFSDVVEGICCRFWFPWFLPIPLHQKKQKSPWWWQEDFEGNDLTKRTHSVSFPDGIPRVYQPVKTANTIANLKQHFELVKFGVRETGGAAYAMLDADNRYKSWSKSEALGGDGDDSEPRMVNVLPQYNTHFANLARRHDQLYNSDDNLEVELVKKGERTSKAKADTLKRRGRDGSPASSYAYDAVSCLFLALEKNVATPDFAFLRRSGLLPKGQITRRHVEIVFYRRLEHFDLKMRPKTLRCILTSKANQYWTETVTKAHSSWRNENKDNLLAIHSTLG